MPPYNRCDSVPASQNAAPLDGASRPPTSDTSDDTRPDEASFREAQKFALPAPAAMRPAFGM